MHLLKRAMQARMWKQSDGGRKLRRHKVERGSHRRKKIDTPPLFFPPCLSIPTARLWPNNLKCFQKVKTESRLTWMFDHILHSFDLLFPSKIKINTLSLSLFIYLFVFPCWWQDVGQQLINGFGRPNQWSFKYDLPADFNALWTTRRRMSSSTISISLWCHSHRSHWWGVMKLVIAMF